MIHARNMSRRAFVILSGTAMGTVSLGLAGCGGSRSAPTADIAVTRTWTTGSFDGTNLLVLDCDIKNNSDTSLPSMILGYANATALQDGSPLSSGYLSRDVPGAFPDTGNISPGATGKGQAVFELQGTGPVEVTISVETLNMESSVEAYKETIDLATVEKVESESLYDLKIDGVTVTDDGEGVNLLVLQATYTNNGDKPASFSSSFDMQVFQNDTELKRGYLPYKHPSTNNELESNVSTSVKKGASLQVQVVYELLNATSAVEVKAIDSTSYDQHEILQKTIEIKGASSAAGSTASASTTA